MAVWQDDNIIGSRIEAFLPNKSSTIVIGKNKKKKYFRIFLSSLSLKLLRCWRFCEEHMSRNTCVFDFRIIY